jgi:putative membrane protein insertion efficiency factor
MTRELPIHAKPFESGGRLGSGVVIGFLTLAIRIYQLSFSPVQSFLFGTTGGCRYTPSCSVYAVDALREHGVVAGSMLAAGRICRCHPWGGCGHDPVPRAEWRSRKAETQNQKSEFSIHG